MPLRIGWTMKAALAVTTLALALAATILLGAGPAAAAAVDPSAFLPAPEALPPAFVEVPERSERTSATGVTSETRVYRSTTAPAELQVSLAAAERESIAREHYREAFLSYHEAGFEPVPIDGYGGAAEASFGCRVNQPRNLLDLIARLIGRFNSGDCALLFRSGAVVGRVAETYPINAVPPAELRRHMLGVADPVLGRLREGPPAAGRPMSDRPVLAPAA